ncbi:MAG: hypothetical protein AAB353_07580 [Candidatus Hydrogenedentota bacterium]
MITTISASFETPVSSVSPHPSEYRGVGIEITITRPYSITHFGVAGQYSPSFDPSIFDAKPDGDVSFVVPVDASEFSADRYAEFADDDRLLADAGMAEYAELLQADDE